MGDANMWTALRTGLNISRTGWAITGARCVIWSGGATYRKLEGYQRLVVQMKKNLRRLIALKMAQNKCCVFSP